MSKVNVYDEKLQVIAQVEYNTNLDNWDGQNMTCGSVGRHLGITKLKKSGQFVLIRGTQWEGEHDRAEIISPNEAVDAIVKNRHKELLDKYPELKAYMKHIETEEE